MVNKTLPSYVTTTRRSSTNENPTVIILAANISYRMKSYGPKSLLNINSHETILDKQINTIKLALPKSEILIVIGFYADRMIRNIPNGIRIIENQLFETTNEVEQLRLAFNNTTSDNVIIVKDDIIFNQKILSNINTTNNSSVIYKQKSNDFKDKEDVGLTVVENKVTFFAYDLDNRWCNIIRLIDKDLIKLKKICSNRNRSKLFLFEALNILIERNTKLDAIHVKNDEIFKINIKE